GAPFARYAVNMAMLPVHAPSNRASPFSFAPGLHITGTRYTASGMVGFGISPFSHAANAVPDRHHTATTRSGCSTCIRLAQKPPPEWPHRHHGAVANSG